MKQFWDERYKQESYVYGKNPNQFFRSKLNNLQPGTIFLPAEGEGRNAVFAAKKGWEVFAWDISTEAEKKARRLAEEEKVKINYSTAPLSSLGLKKGEFDAIALIYVHFPAEERKDLFRYFQYILKDGGQLIFEGFGSKHVDYQKRDSAVGGPKEAKMLFSLKEIKDAFTHLEILEFYEGEIELNEGAYHKGTGWVIRFVGQKKG